MYAIIGNTTVDLFNSGIDRMPGFGGDEFTTSNLAFCRSPLHLVLGGNSAIACYVLAKLGAHAVNCAAIGQDRLGDLVQEWLTEAGVNTRGLLRMADAATPTTTVMTDDALNRIAFHHPGASAVYAPAHLPENLWPDLEVLLLASFSLLPAWRPAGFAAVAARARQAGIVTALDIGPAIGQPVVFAELRDLLPDIDYFLCNAHELAVCTQEADVARGMRRILDAGATCVVIKRGVEGARVWANTDDSPCDVPGFGVDARFTVGAGDSFNAGFLYATQGGKTPTQAARFANAVAAFVVSAAQGALGAPNLAQVEAMLAV